MNLEKEIDEEIRSIVSQKLRSIEICLLHSWRIENCGTLNKLCDEGTIDYDFIEQNLKVGVLNQARKYFKLMTHSQHTKYMDDVGYQEYFAYALVQREFSKKEIKKIPFDKGDNAETFSQQYRKENLLSELRERLLHPD